MNKAIALDSNQIMVSKKKTVSGEDEREKEVYAAVLMCTSTAKSAVRNHISNQYIFHISNLQTGLEEDET